MRMRERWQWLVYLVVRRLSYRVRLLEANLAVYRAAYEDLALKRQRGK